MKLVFRKVADPGVVAAQGGKRERIIFDVMGKGNTAGLMLFDSTFGDEHEPSNVHRHLFLFPAQEVDDLDTVVVYSGPGKRHQKPLEDNDGSKYTCYFFYWGLETSVWNKDGDEGFIVPMGMPEQFVISEKKK